MKSVKFYFAGKQFDKVVKQKHAYFNGLVEAMKLHGLRTSVQRLDESTKFMAGILDDYAILDKLLVDRDNCFTIRRAIFVPYWSVERAEYRDGFRLFNKSYDPSTIDPIKAQVFAEQLRRKTLGTKKPITELGDGVFIPLQSKMLDQRHGQSMSPIDMIRTVRAQEPNRPIYLRSHPADDLSNEEREALADLCKEIDAQITDEAASVLFRKSRYMVTMNSSMGFEAILYGLPLMLFGDADFHHVAVNVKDYDNIKDAFAKINEPAVLHDRYVKWYLDDNMISANKPDAIPKTLEYLRELGMEIPKY